LDARFSRRRFILQEVHMSRLKRLLPLCFVLLGVPPTVHAQGIRPVPADQRYCVTLSRSYQRYVVSTTTTPRANAAGGYAKAACKQHRPMEGIPILETKLDKAKVPLPPAPPPSAAFAR
jgi:hypothetical protein